MWVVLTLISLFVALMFGMFAFQICWAILKWLVKLLYRFVLWCKNRNA